MLTALVSGQKNSIYSMFPKTLQSLGQIDILNVGYTHPSISSNNWEKKEAHK